VISKSDGFIVTQITVDTYQLPSAGIGNTIDAFHGADCSAKSGFLQVNPPSLGMTTVPMDPGFAIPKGGSLSFEETSSDIRFRPRTRRVIRK
jgi:hypothetical protein